MPPKRNASTSRSRSRSRGRKTPRKTQRSTSRTRTRAAPAAAPVAAQPAVVTPLFNEPKESAPSSLWEADAKLTDAMSSGRSHVRSTGVHRLFHNKKGRVWGYWIAIIVFQVIAIVWAKWAIDMYKQYRLKAH